MKNYYSYHYIKQHTDRPCGGSSIIVSNIISHSEITLNTNMQAVTISATLHKTITVCSVYIPLNEEPKELELNKLIEQLPRPFLIIATGTYSAIDLSICDPSLFLDYIWKVHDNTCGSDHFPILSQNTADELNKKTPSWNLGKANWDGFKTSCLAQLTPEANKNNEENILYFTNTQLNIAEEHIPKSSTSTKYNRPWF